MTKTNLIRMAALALASVLAGGATASATVVSNGGDLILAFRTTDNSVALNLTVDLGPASTIAALGPGSYNFNIGGFLPTGYGLSAQDLSDVYSSNAALVWSVAGGSGGASNNTLYVTSPTATLSKHLASQQNSVLSSLNQIRTTISGATSTANSTESTIVGSGVSTSYSSLIRPGAATADYNYSTWGTTTTEALVPLSGTSTLNFFSIPSAASGSVSPSGTFSLSSDGTFTYTVVPEPSAIGLLGLVGIGFLGLRRNRALAQA